VQDLSTLQGHTKSLKGSGLARDVRRQLYARGSIRDVDTQDQLSSAPLARTTSPLERRYAQAFRLALRHPQR
jgi:hypothetical protein